MSCYVMLCRVMLCRVVSCRIVSCRVVSCSFMLCSRYFILFNFESYYVVSAVRGAVQLIEIHSHISYHLV